MNTQTGNHESNTITGRTAEVWPSGAIVISQDDVILYESKIKGQVTAEGIQLIMAQDTQGEAEIAIKIALTGATFRTDAQATGYWAETVTVPVSDKEEIDLTRAEVKRIARAAGNLQNLKLNGEQYAYHRRMKELQEGIYGEFGLKNSEARNIYNWYSQNIYSPEVAATWI
jgi:hypothetical protein